MHRAAIAEHRLLRRIPFFRSEHAHTWAEEERTAAPALLDSGKVQVETAGTRIAAATTATTTTYIGGPVSSDESVALPDSDTDMGARPRRFGPPITPIPSNLDRNPHHVHPNNRATACTRLIDIGDGHHINTFIMDTDGNVDDLIQQQRKTLVICHGFGAGLGFYYKNYTGLSVMPGLRVFSVDWLGMGRSSRAELPPRAKGVPLGHREDVEAVESFFVESLERWRASCNIERMTLCGHSLGGYLGIAYALRYPERVEKLILASPVGIPEAPVVNPFLENATATQRRMYGVFSGLWSSNVTPQSVVRALGPFSREYGTAAVVYSF